MEGFAKTLRIKGLGPKTIEKLDLEYIEDIYMLTEEHITQKLGSEKIARFIFKEIQSKINY